VDSGGLDSFCLENLSAVLERLESLDNVDSMKMNLSESQFFQPPTRLTLEEQFSQRPLFVEIQDLEAEQHRLCRERATINSFALGIKIKANV
jgi:hypothetical protein